MDIKYHYCNPEIWGGIECTINRVNDSFFDQLEYAGQYQRNDIALLGELGIKALRFPVLWERHMPTPNQQIDWAWAEERLNQLRSLDIVPIVGLVHHGSGPDYTNLMDVNFAPGLADYALEVAKKFPWIEYYTPVNEPLTTARFSGLYGIWYPHHTSDRSFVRILINQIKAVVQSMQAIRTVNPSAKLIQTEDLSKIYSTPLLRYQATFENHRRWLTFDLLSGKVDPNHPLWTYLRESGISQEELMFFYNNPCPPDILGFNYYITSERYLDQDLQKYPPHTHGGNGNHRYADVEAVRVNLKEESGLEILLREAWQRFRLPMAMTEVHLHCTREEQLRWFKEKYETCCKLSQEGIPVKAVTAWSLFGAYGWNRLLTVPHGDYEPGVYSLQSDIPRPTALANYIKNLTRTDSSNHPVLNDLGWWKRDMRLLYDNDFDDRPEIYCNNSATPILIIGKNGTLGRAFARICEDRGIGYRLLSRQDLNICNRDDIEEAINQYRPWAVVNTAGFVRVDDAEQAIEQCFSDNARGPYLLSIACKRHGIKLMTFSSDLVFDGQKNSAYVESDLPNPLNVYGRSKAESEVKVLEQDSSSLVIRTSAFFGPWDQYNFVNHVASTLMLGEHCHVMNDVHISPTYVPDLVNTTLDLLIDDEQGIWHVANHGEITWADLANEVARIGGFNRNLIRSRSLHSMHLKAPRPVYSVLRSEKGIILPSIDNALNRYFDAKCHFRIAEAV